MLRGMVLVGLALLLSGAGSASAQVAAGGLGTRVNGTALGRCNAGVCSVQGGSAAGPNLFHRFSQFDTRSGIQRVDLDSRGRSNVVVGVSHPAGSFFAAPLQLSSAANLFWLSPGGIWLGSGARFQGATSLLLSTSPSLRIGGGLFSAAGGLADRLGVGAEGPTPDPEDLARGGLTGDSLASGSGAIVLAGGRLTVDRHLLLHSGAGPILSAPGGRSALMAGGSVQLSGGQLALQGVDVQAGSGAGDQVLLRSGPLVGGGVGRLQLNDASLRGRRVLLEGAGGLDARDLQARAGGDAEAGEIQILSGATGGGGRRAAMQLEQVWLSGGDVLIRSSGPLTANQLKAEAGGNGAGGRLQLEAGPSEQESGNVSLRLERSELGGRSVVIDSQGLSELRDVRGASGGQGENGEGLWLRSRQAPGGRPGGLVLEDVDLQGDQLVLEAAGHVQARDLRGKANRIWVSALGSKPGEAGLTLQGRSSLKGLPSSDGESAARQVTVSTAHGDISADSLLVKASRIRLEAGGRLSLGPGSELLARGERQEEGQIQLAALSPKGASKSGSLLLNGTTLQASTIVARADQSLVLRGVEAQAGDAGDRGAVLLETAPADPLPGGPGSGLSGEVRLEGGRITGQRVSLRGGVVSLVSSAIEAPKGKIQLLARQSDLDLVDSHLDVGVRDRRDLRTEVNASVFGDDSTFNTPTIGLYAKGNLRLSQGSRLVATQDLAAFRQEVSGLDRSQIRLTDTSGIIVLDTASGLAVIDSTIQVNASDNLAGNILLRSNRELGTDGVDIRRSALSASGGVGSGDIRINSASGIRIESSTLTTNSSHSPEDPARPGTPSWERIAEQNGAFQGGEITLTNSDPKSPISILDSQLIAEQTSAEAPRSMFNLTGFADDNLFTDIFDDGDRAASGLLGGVINIFSAGGIEIAGEQSRLSTSSPATNSSATGVFGGIIRLVNLSDSQPLQIHSGARLDSSSGAAAPLEVPIELTTGGVVNAWSLGPISINQAAIDSQTRSAPGQDPASSPYQGGIALYSQQQISLLDSTVRFGPVGEERNGLGSLTMRSPQEISISNSQLIPGCDVNCNTDWDDPAFLAFIDGSGKATLWGPNRMSNANINPAPEQSALRGLSPYRIKDEVFTGNDRGKTSLPDDVQRWIEERPARIVFAQGQPPIDLRDLKPAQGKQFNILLSATSNSPGGTPQQPQDFHFTRPAALMLDQNAVQIMQALSDRSSAPETPLSMGSVNSERMPETIVVESLIKADQRASREVIAALGLRQHHPGSLGVDGLQKILRESMPQQQRKRSASEQDDRQQPAILQISLSASRRNGQTQINHILIPASGEIRGWQTQIASSALKQAIRTFQQQQIEQGDSNDQEAGRKLSAVLLQPIWQDIKQLGINSLLLSLDRGLQGIPFSALPIENDRVVDHVALTVTPALGLTDLKTPAAASPPQRIVLAGASHFVNGLMPLTMTGQELRQLARLHSDSLLLLDKDFKMQTLLAKTRERPVSILHLATHADFDHQHADRTRIYTSDGELSLVELGEQLRYSQPEPMSLFVLNACRTAVGDEEKELGIAGLALQTGSSSALGNLWYVDDVVTAAFSIQFHRTLQEGISKDQALRRTQQLFQLGRIKVRERAIVNDQNEVLISGLSGSDQARLSDLSHPYFWAGAVLTGRPW